jgi:hypothetical protein
VEGVEDTSNDVLFLVGRATEEYSLSSTPQSGISATAWVYDHHVVVLIAWK